MSRKIKESSPSSNTSLDEIKALINGRFDEFSEKLASIAESLIRLQKRFIWNLIRLKKTQRNLELKLGRTVIKLKV